MIDDVQYGQPGGTGVELCASTNTWARALTFLGRAYSVSSVPCLVSCSNLHLILLHSLAPSLFFFEN
jgi:hypothetical protein